MLQRMVVPVVLLPRLWLASPPAEAAKGSVTWRCLASVSDARVMITNAERDTVTATIKRFNLDGEFVSQNRFSLEPRASTIWPVTFLTEVRGPSRLLVDGWLVGGDSIRQIACYKRS